eukprot:764376-Hanusia_phi.AAC.3
MVGGCVVLASDSLSRMRKRREVLDAVAVRQAGVEACDPLQKVCDEMTLAATAIIDLSHCSQKVA